MLDYLEKRDNDARNVADLILNSDIIESAELAVHLGCYVPDIANTKKRLRRYVRIYMESIKEECPAVREEELGDMKKQLSLVDED